MLLRSLICPFAFVEFSAKKIRCALPCSQSAYRSKICSLYFCYMDFTSDQDSCQKLDAGRILLYGMLWRNRAPHVNPSLCYIIEPATYRPHPATRRQNIESIPPISPLIQI